MHDDDQTQIPLAFVDLFVIAPGHRNLREPRHVIAARHELCEDMAQMFTEHARARQFDLHISEEEVLERMHAGLLSPGSGVDEMEAGWVVCRLAELLDWPIPQLPPKTD